MSTMPIHMFDEFCDYLLTEEPMANINLGLHAILWLSSLRAHQQALKTTGVTYGPTPITQVQQTAKIGSGGGVNTIGVSWGAQPPFPPPLSLPRCKIMSLRPARSSSIGIPSRSTVDPDPNGTFPVLVNENINFQ